MKFIRGRTDYVQKMNSILCDGTKFQKLGMKLDDSYKILRKMDTTMRTTIKKLWGEGKISSKDCDSLCPSGSRPGIMYGLSKVHKPNAPLRPITSAIGTPSYSTAKWLVEKLRPITSNKYTVKDSFSFAKELVEGDWDDCFMASLDVESLFTNIPLDETIEICSKTVSNLSLSDSSTLTSSDFTQLLKLCTSESIFSFDGDLYKQVDGVAMGSPLGPALSNAFLANKEPVWLDRCPLSFKPVLYRRYVDDIFVLLKDKSHLQPFLKYMNSCHANIKFTSEIETNGKFNFLDISINRNQNKFETGIYRKPTFSGVFVNYGSFIPASFKLGLIQTLLVRAFRICSSSKNFNIELNFVKSILRKNGFPLSLIDNCFTKFLNSVNRPSQSVSSVPKKSVLLVLPYIGPFSEILKRRVTNLMQNYSHVNCKIVFRAPKRIAHMFSFKDRIPKCLKSCVVYKFQCSSCHATYYGQTKRHLHTRTCEHIGISSLTGRPVKVPDEKHTAVYRHVLSSGHTASLEDFDVLASSPYEFHLRILESLLISKDKPLLNNNVRSEPLALF